MKLNREDTIKSYEYTKHNREILRQTEENKCGCISCKSTYSKEEVTEWTTLGEVKTTNGKTVIEREDGEESLVGYKFSIIGRGATGEKINTKILIEGIKEGDTAICPRCNEPCVVSIKSVAAILRKKGWSFSQYLEVINKQKERSWEGL